MAVSNIGVMKQACSLSPLPLLASMVLVQPGRIVAINRGKLVAALGVW